jgi:hypothetical protein
MTIELFNGTGQIDLSRIDDSEVAKLDPERKAALDRLIAAVLARTKAEQRLAVARNRVRIAMANEEATLGAHQAQTPPPTFQQIRQASIDAFKH